MEIDHAHIIRQLGGVTAVAQRLNIKPPSVSPWAKSGIPDGRMLELAVDVEAVTKYKRWHLRPSDWHLIWPELIGTKGAPTVKSAVAEPIPTWDGTDHRNKASA
jgi:DNA-binding transcriptional regulator YdaS (Cro superfamily)